MPRRAICGLALVVTGVLAPAPAEARRSPLEGAVAIACGWDRRAGRFEIEPSVGVSVGDPLVRHVQGNLGPHYWVTNDLAIGTETQLHRGEALAALDEIGGQ